MNNQACVNETITPRCRMVSRSFSPRPAPRARPSWIGRGASARGRQRLPTSVGLSFVRRASSHGRLPSFGQPYGEVHWWDRRHCRSLACRRPPASARLLHPASAIFPSQQHHTTARKASPTLDRLSRLVGQAPSPRRETSEAQWGRPPKLPARGESRPYFTASAGIPIRDDPDLRCAMRWHLPSILTLLSLPTPE